MSSLRVHCTLVHTHVQANTLQVARYKELKSALEKQSMFKIKVRDCSDGSVVKSTCCLSCRGLGFGSQNPYGGSQSPVTSVSGV